mgnify:CR=1 FL=1
MACTIFEEILINSESNETEKPYHHFRLIVCRLRLHTGTVHPSYRPPWLLENQRFGTELHCRTGESRLHRLLRLRVRCMLTADNQLVVNHDSTFKGVNMQKSTAQQCTGVTLDNGEQLPTLQQYLEKARSLETRPHPRTESPQDSRTGDARHRSHREDGEGHGTGRPHGIHHFLTPRNQRFIRLAPKGTPVYYLEGDLSPKELKAWGCAGPDYHFSVFKKHPEWIKESHDLGMKVNAWTVNDPKDMKWLIGQGVDFITTNEPVKLQEILQ